MASAVLTGDRSRVTSDFNFPARFLNFRSTLAASGARIVLVSLTENGLDVDWRPADADPELEPIRSSLVAPGQAEADLLAERDNLIDVSPDVSALVAWRARRGQ
jgi:hypothetical protein